MLLLAAAIQACHSPDHSLINKQLTAADKLQITALIAAGKRVETINNDSLHLVSQRLFKLSGDDTALVYAQLFETTFLWQASEHQKAMAAAIKCLGDAERLHINQALPQVYSVIANLHKETTNYDMAFKAAGNGLNAAIANKDTDAIISLLGLKAMFTRSVNLNHHDPGPDKSIGLNLEALKMAESSPKYERLRTRFYDNIAQYYKDTHDFDKAFYYGNKGVANALKFNQQRSLTYAYCWLGQATYFKGRQTEGIALLNKAMQIASNLKEPYRVMEINGHIYDCYIFSKNYKEAIKYYDLYRNMRDSLKVLDNVKQISELQLKYEAAEKDKKINNLNAKTQIDSLQRDAAVVVLILLIAITALIYIKGKKSKRLLLSEKMLLDEELKSAELELLYFTENLKQKNELIEEFKAEIEHLHLQNISAIDRESLESLINAHIMTDENWDSFKRLFSKVHTGFFEKLIKKFPNLTATDTRMLALIKLQLSNSEMANMLGITIEGIKKSKQRLRKKLDLNKDDSIESFVAAL